MKTPKHPLQPHTPTHDQPQPLPPNPHQRIPIGRVSVDKSTSFDLTIQKNMPIAKITDKKAQYTRNKGLDTDLLKSFILKHIDIHGTATLPEKR